MNHPGAGEAFVESQVRQPASPVPGPVGDGRINPAGEDDGVGEVSEELASLRNGSAHNRGSGGSEHKLREKIEIIRAK